MTDWGLDLELKHTVKKTIAKARQSLRETRVLNDGGFPSGAVSRAYSAMFHGAAAVLLTRNLEIIKPSAIVASFDREVTRQGHIDRQYLTLLAGVHEAFHVAEYDIAAPSVEVDGNKALTHAEQFVDHMELYLHKNGWL